MDSDDRTKIVKYWETPANFAELRETAARDSLTVADYVRRLVQRTVRNKRDRSTSEVPVKYLKDTPDKQPPPFALSPTPPISQPTPKSKKTPSASQAKAEGDPRHDVVRKMIQAAYKLKNGTVCPWDGRTGNTLKRLLKKIPSWTVDEIGACIAARFVSEVNHAESPEVWIPQIPMYRNGPLDRYKKPLEDKYAGIERAFGKSSTPDGENVSAEPEARRSGDIPRVV